MKSSLNTLVARRRVFYSDLILVLAALSFSTSFILQRAALVDGIKPFVFNASRFALSTFILLIASPIIPESLKTIKTLENSVSNEKTFVSTMKWGLLLGVLNFLGTTFQQWGISMTSASKCAFMTGFYVFFVPVITTCLSSYNGSKLPMSTILKTWFAVGISLTGLFLLSGASLSDMSMGRGEAVTLVGTVFWTAHVMITDMAMNHVDTVSISIAQFAAVMMLSLLAAVNFELASISYTFLLTNFHWIFFLSLSEGGGFFLTAIGQRYAPPSHVAFIFSLESVFTSLGGYTFLNEHLTRRDMLGCFLLISSTLFSQMCIFNQAHGNGSGHLTAIVPMEDGGECGADDSCSSRSSSSIKQGSDSVVVVKRKKAESSSNIVGLSGSNS